MAKRLQNQIFEKGIIGSSGTCVAHSYVFKKRIEVERRTITEEQIPEEIQRLDFAIKKTVNVAFFVLLAIVTKNDNAFIIFSYS